MKTLARRQLDISEALDFIDDGSIMHHALLLSPASLSHHRGTQQIASLEKFHQTAGRLEARQ